ncbi:hypothetical protein C8J57DRAFT_1252811 [Mycena rebaudengoi]|nr:hypothetical protein C8J57DRAFT_1252811 [Mycena rebaudengoi]
MSRTPSTALPCGRPNTLAISRAGSTPAAETIHVAGSTPGRLISVTSSTVGTPVTSTRPLPPGIAARPSTVPPTTDSPFLTANITSTAPIVTLAAAAAVAAAAAPSMRTGSEASARAAPDQTERHDVNSPPPDGDMPLPLSHMVTATQSALNAAPAVDTAPVVDAASGFPALPAPGEEIMTASAADTPPPTPATDNSSTIAVGVETASETRSDASSDVDDRHLAAETALAIAASLGQDIGTVDPLASTTRPTPCNKWFMTRSTVSPPTPAATPPIPRPGAGNYEQGPNSPVSFVILRSPKKFSGGLVLPRDLAFSSRYLNVPPGTFRVGIAGTEDPCSHAPNAGIIAGLPQFLVNTIVAAETISTTAITFFTLPFVPVFTRDLGIIVGLGHDDTAAGAVAACLDIQASLTQELNPAFMQHILDNRDALPAHFTSDQVIAAFTASIHVVPIHLATSGGLQTEWRVFAIVTTHNTARYYGTRAAFTSIIFFTFSHGARVRADMNCEHCFSIDHPTGVCPFPLTAGWMGNTHPAPAPAPPMITNIGANTTTNGRGGGRGRARAGGQGGRGN